MPLSPDQRALLQLLCERGQSYEDIAGLLGGTAQEVRGRARSALAELGGSDPDAEVGLTDYLLGQADPIGRADAVRHLQADPEALELASRIEASLRLFAPQAKLPKLPEPRGKRRRAAVAAADADDTPARTGDPERIERSPSGQGRPVGSRQSAVFAGLAAGAVILLVAILAIAGVFGSDDGSDGEATEPPTASVPENPDDPAPGPATNITTVDLEPVGESGVAGSAEFGIVDASQLYVDVDVDGLDPQAPQSGANFLWLMVNEQLGYPLSEPLAPDQNGGFSGRIAIPAAVASTVAGQASAVKVSSSPIRELLAATEDAANRQEPVVQFTGDELASGEIPLVEGGQAGAGQP